MGCRTGQGSTELIDSNGATDACMHAWDQKRESLYRTEEAMHGSAMDMIAGKWRRASAWAVVMPGSVSGRSNVP